jgi:hypothetical protein
MDKSKKSGLSMRKSTLNNMYFKLTLSVLNQIAKRQVNLTLWYWEIYIFRIQPLRSIE